MEKVQTIIDEFVDFEGKTHKFMVAAVSMYEESAVVVDDNNVIELPKSVRIGVAICNPNDEWNLDIAHEISVGRAKKNTDYALYSTRNGMINTRMVTALLIQEAEFIKSNPESVMPHYAEAKRKYNYKKYLKEIESKLSDTEKSAVQVLKNADENTLDNIIELVNA